MIYVLLWLCAGGVIWHGVPLLPKGWYIHALVKRPVCGAAVVIVMAPYVALLMGSIAVYNMWVGR